MVNINQLFIKKPPELVVLKIIKYLGICTTHDYHTFTLENLKTLKTVAKINKDINILQSYYLPCKHLKYLDNITPKKCITIARQLLRLYNYDIISTEKSINNKKILIYRLAHRFKKDTKKKHKEYILIFD